jgi:hypothetical protein
MSESSSEIIVSQAERFRALWNFLSPDNKPFSGLIELDFGEDTREAAIVSTKLEDINPKITDSRIIQTNNAPDARIIECVTRERTIRCSELGIILDGTSRYTADQLAFLEQVVFSENQIGVTDFPDVSL